MNAKIKLLAEQAGFVMWEDESWNPGDTIDWGCRYDDEFKKFAQLIVRECAELIDNKEMLTAAQTYDAFFVAKYDTKELCAKQIKEHFGVDCA